MVESQDVMGFQWFNKDVEQKTQLKQKVKKKYEHVREELNRLIYKQYNKEANKEVTMARFEAYGQLQNEFKTKKMARKNILDSKIAEHKKLRHAR